MSEIRSLWPSGGAIGKVSTLPHATGTPANIWAINPYGFESLNDPFLAHPGFPGRDNVVIAEARSLYTSKSAESYGRFGEGSIGDGPNRIVLVNDAGQSKPWELLQKNYDAKGRLDNYWIRYDNETGQLRVNDFKFVDIDQGGMAGWSRKTTYVDERYFIRYKMIEYRDGTKTVEMYDHQSSDWYQQPDWITHTYTHWIKGATDRC